MGDDDARSQALSASPDPVVARTPVLLILDTDGAMCSRTEDGEGNLQSRIEQINAGLQEFKTALCDDFETASRTDIAVVTFGGDVTIEHGFTNVNHWDPPTLSAGGTIPMVEALCESAHHLEEYQKELQAAHVPYRPAFVWLAAGGPPTDAVSERWETAKEIVNAGTRNEEFWFYTSSIERENEIDALAELQSVASNHGKARPLRSERGDIRSYFAVAAEAVRRQINGYTASDRVRRESADVADDVQDF
ncbi:vWA domain-containing protein [Haloarcula sediminis]|uniref:vWA domain-containing protein n=1 Tax=Haloarcula sediminis TaxID=3111777 RepID=UPI002D7A2C19|nr:hypothetical protein [Haloarcula sp. CK38]